MMGANYANRYIKPKGNVEAIMLPEIKNRSEACISFRFKMDADRPITVADNIVYAANGNRLYFKQDPNGFPMRRAGDTLWFNTANDVAKDWVCNYRYGFFHLQHDKDRNLYFIDGTEEEA